MSCTTRLHGSRIRTSCAIAALLAVAVTPATAQTALPGIVVEGTSIQARPIRPPAPDADTGGEVAADDRESDGIPIDRVGTAVTVVTRQQLERQQIRNAADALRSLPGVSVGQSGTAGNLTEVRIRGAETRHTLVLIDGVEVNSRTDGGFDFSNLGAEDIERIEVLRGPQSGIYGTGAIGGVVNITTRSGRGPLTLTFKGEVGTDNTRAGTARLSGGSDDAWGSLIVHAYRTDGFNISTSGNEDDGTRIGSFAFRGGVRATENLQFEATLREQNTKAEYDQSFGGILNGLDVPSDAPFFGDTRLRVGSLKATWETFDKRWVHRFQLNGAETYREDFDPGRAETTSTNSKLSYTSTFRLDAPGSPVRHFLTGLVEKRFETFEQPNVSPIKREMERESIVGEIRGEYFNTLFLTASLRHDGNDFFQDFTTWHVAGSLKIPGTILRLHASAGTGVKYPSFGDLFGTFPGFVPNPDLVPEESLGFDVGVEATLWRGRAVLDVTYFNADLTNEIAFSSVFPGPTLVNLIGESHRQGIEVSARYLLTPQLTLGGAYTFLDAEQPDGSPERRRPRHTGRVDVNWAFLEGRGNLNLAAIYNGKNFDNAFEPFPTFTPHLVSLDPYWLLRVAASYQVQPGVEVFGRLENLLDDRYQEVFGYNATGGFGAFAGVKLTLGGPDGIAAGWAK